ncbi:hypothetical protein GRS96_03615 [Rathayibacter sp. VKM Ac-2803]|uniref:septum formation family protein n=1 Tax=Rathayibacter sp. VKM Ac-2803 TaxID=2609256 RepID=UPI0013596FF0|nr:septum formation family protein [Rathayibacter sp. VKM Ac-2803]MWV48364.1 hypothetical protein [Rathayibacter sp. VKM Ac-2803]
MVDERGREGDESGRADRPKDSERPTGGSDWLLQQLSDGRLKSIFDAPRQRPTQPISPPADDSGDESSVAPGSDGSSSATSEVSRTEASEPSAEVTVDGEGAAPSDADGPAEEAPAATGARPVASAVWPAEPLRVDPPQAAPHAADADSADEAPAAAAPVVPATDDSAAAPVAGASAPRPESSTTDGRSEWTPAERAPIEPEPVAPEPVAPEPTAPEPAAPEPTAPEPVAPGPVTPEPVVSEPTTPPQAEERSPSAPDEQSPAVPSARPDARRDQQAPTSAPPAQPLPVAEPPRDLPTAPPRLRAEARRRDDRPQGATPPAPRDPAESDAVASDAVYHWPDPRGGWDAPPVWEEVVAPREEPDDDGGDEELWRETAGAYAWNLEPTAEDDEQRADGAAASEPDAAPTSSDAPFRTAPASDHVNASGAKEPRSWGLRSDRTRTPKEPIAPTEPRTPREPRPAKGPRAAKEPRPPKEPRAPKAPRAVKEPRPPRTAPAASISSLSPERAAGRRRLLIGLIAVGVIIVLAALVALGIAVGSAGERSDGAAAPVSAATDPASETPAAEPSAAPTAELPTVGPLPAGTWSWNALLGGECLQPFDSVWAEEFTVVDCTAAHSAEMVDTGQLTDAAFPGQEGLAVSVASICQAEGVVDVTGAEAYGDVQVSGAFPVTQEQWDAGERSYYCFVDRAGGGELIGTLDGTPSA